MWVRSVQEGIEGRLALDGGILVGRGSFFFSSSWADPMICVQIMGNPEEVSCFMTLFSCLPTAVLRLCRLVRLLRSNMAVSVSGSKVAGEAPRLNFLHKFPSVALPVHVSFYFVRGK